jgi:hypothetical protein
LAAEVQGRAKGHEPLWFEGRDFDPGVATRCRGEAIADLDVLPSGWMRVSLEIPP